MSKLPSGWMATPLENVADVIRGVTYDKKEAISTPKDGYLPILRATNIGAALDLESQMVYVPQRYVKPTQRMRSGDIVVAASSGSASVVGKSAQLRTEWEGGFGAFCAVVRPAAGMSAQYLAHFVAGPSVRRAWRDLAQGTNINNLKGADFAGTVIPIAPRPEQERIVAAIEEQFSRLEAAVEALRKARRLAQTWQTSVLDRSAAQLALSAPMRAVGDLASLVTKGTTPTSVGFGFEAAGVRFVKVESLQDGRIIHDRCSAVSQMTHDALARSQLAEHDVLVSIAGTLGTVALVRAEDCPANTNQAIALIRLKDPGYAGVLAAWLRGPVSQRALRLGAKGVGMNNLTLQQIRDLEVPVASHHASTSFREVEAVTREIATSLVQTINQMTRRVSNLRAAILSAAFSGNLAPSDPADEPAKLLLDRIASQREASKHNTPTRFREPRRRRTKVTHER